MAQPLRVLPALADTPGLLPSPSEVAYHVICNASSKGADC